jgi:hypothetical protein
VPNTGLPEDVASYVADLVSAVEARDRGRNDRIDGVRDRRFGRNRVPIPEEYDKITQQWHSPLIRHLIRGARAALGNELPGPKVYPPAGKTGIEAQSNTTLREDWFRAGYQKMFGGDLYGQITDGQPADSYVVWQVTMRADKWGSVRRKEDESDTDYTDRTAEWRGKNFPFIARFVPGKSFHRVAKDDDGRLAEVLEITEHEARPVASKYGLYPKDGKLSVGPPAAGSVWPEKCTVWRWSNLTHCVIFVDGDEVQRVKHNYNHTSYYYAPFSSTSVEDPEFATEGIADAVLETHDALESAIAMIRNWGTLSAFPVWRLRPIDPEAVSPNTKAVIEWKPGGTVKAPDGFVWEATTLPATGQDIRELVKFFKDLIDQISLAPILQGQMQGDLSGPAASAAISLAKSVLGTGLVNIGVCFDEMAAWMQEMIEKRIKAPVPIYYKGRNEWLELGPDDIKGYYDVTHQLQPLIRLERMQDAIMWADAQARGAVDMNTYREKGLGLENPEEYDVKVRVEQAVKTPEYQRPLMERFLTLIEAPLPSPEPPQGTPEGLPVGPGGPGVPMVAGVQQGMQPGMPQNPMVAPPPPNGLPVG